MDALHASLLHQKSILFSHLEDNKTMTLDLLIRYLHFIGIFVWVSTLVSEWLLVAKQLPRATIKRLLRIDRVYGVAAIIVVGTGLLQWFVVGKPAEFYTSNGIFHAKVGLAVVVGVLSVYPSLFFFRSSKGEDQTELIEVPNRVGQLINWQLALILVIPFLATLMAAGVGR